MTCIEDCAIQGTLKKHISNVETKTIVLYLFHEIELGSGLGLRLSVIIFGGKN